MGRANCRHWLTRVLGLVCAGLFCAVGAGAETQHYGPSMNYMLHCQGCHMADGSGKDQFVPSFRNSVARFLATAEGRTYLMRVPGVSQSLLTDRERAEVTNWIVTTFDVRNLPRDFVPFSAAEFAVWRHDALSEPLVARARLIAQLDAGAGPNPASAVVADSAGAVRVEGTAVGDAPVDPPAAFRACAGCHTVSGDESHGMGPNLRGVVGRRAGSAANFAYSPAIGKSGVTWTTRELDRFLAAPGRAIPGNFMALPGVQDPATRRAIIDYLVSLDPTRR